MQLGACIVLLAALLQTTWAAGCKYGKGEGYVKGDCDAVTNQRTTTMVLKRGDHTQCAATKEFTKPCKGGNDGCKYQKSRDEGVSSCDPVTREKTLTLTRTQGTDDKCPATKAIKKPCVPEGCVYSDGEWSECAGDATESTRVDTLVTSPEGVTCEPTMERKRSCHAVAKKEARKEARKQEKKEGKKADKADKKNGKKQEKKEKKKQNREERKDKRKERRERKNKRGGEEAGQS